MQVFVLMKLVEIGVTCMTKQWGTLAHQGYCILCTDIGMGMGMYSLKTLKV